jgi:hypothetical protein
MEDIKKTVTRLKDVVPDFDPEKFKYHQVKLEIDDKTTGDVLSEIYNAFYDIPFENSAFQTEMFVLASQITPERAYRALGLKIINRLNDVENFMLDLELEQYIIEELIEKMNDDSQSQVERKKAEIELKKIARNKPYVIKLLNDAIVEINLLFSHFKTYPRYTREEFEAGEFRHYLERSKRQSIGIDGGKESIVNMLHDYKNIETFKEKVAELTDSQRHLLEQITEEIISSACTQENSLLNKTMLK